MSKSFTTDHVNVIKDHEYKIAEFASLPLGTKIKKQREAKNISLEALAAQMHISKQIIQSIENDNYSNIVAPIYARGYLRSIAKILALPEEEILNDFDKLNIFDKKTLFEDKSSYVANDQRIEIQSSSNAHSHKVGTKYLISFIIALIVVIGIALLLGHSWRKTIESNSDQSDTAAIPAAQSQQAQPAPGLTADSAVKNNNDQEVTTIEQPMQIETVTNANKEVRTESSVEKSVEDQ